LSATNSPAKSTAILSPTRPASHVPAATNPTPTTTAEKAEETFMWIDASSSKASPKLKPKPVLPSSRLKLTPDSRTRAGRPSAKTPSTPDTLLSPPQSKASEKLKEPERIRQVEVKPNPYRDASSPRAKPAVMRSLSDRKNIEYFSHPLADRHC
jgi:hypothetical protein